MMGNKDYLSGGCDIWVDVQLSQGNCYEKLDKKKSENDYMIMPENFNGAKEGALIPCLAHPPPPPPKKKKKKKKKDLDSLSKFTY